MKGFSWAALLLILVLSSHAFAQVNAVLTGTVGDASGALIPGVEITAKNINTGIASMRVSNETGAFVFPSLQPGTYTLTALLPGFQTARYDNVVLGQGQQVRLNFTLQVGGAAQNVEVTIPADTLIATTSASVGNVLPDSTVTALPLADRNILGLVQTTPGVVASTNVFGGTVYTFGGTPISQVNTMRDGLTTNDGRYNNSNGAYSAVYTSPDMVEEVRITANNIDPSLGRGSAQVQMLTRSGSNEFHGALFYTNNNSKFITQPWFSNLVGANPSYENRNQFGGRLGGPIKKNKAFFFVLIDDQRFLEKQNVVRTVLTPSARQGIFRYLSSGAPGAAGGVSRKNGNALSVTPSVNLAGQTLSADPLTGTPLFLNSFDVFNDVKDPNRTKIDQAWFATQYLTRMPLPNDWTAGDGLNTAGFRWRQPHEGLDGATGQSSNPNRNHLTTRVDYQLNQSNKFTYTMSREKDWGVTGQTGLPDYPAGAFGQVQRVPDFYTASWTSTISPTVLNEFRFGMKRDSWQGTSPLDRGCCWNGAKQNNIDSISQKMVASYPSVDGHMVYVQNNMGLGLYAGMNVSSPRQSISPFKQFSDTISFTKGAHSFQAGAEFIFSNSHGFNTGGSQTTRPSLTLGAAAAVPVQNITTAQFKGLNPLDITTAQNLLANLAGSVQSITQQYFVNSPNAADWTDYRTSIIFERDQHQNDFDFFLKDNWKVTRNLTLNLGVRYDKYGVPYDTTGLGGRYVGGLSSGGGQAALFGCSGTNFNALWNPNAGCDPTKLTTTQFVGKDSPNPGKQFWADDWNNIAPSIGFSYSIPHVSHSTVLRGGYGINYAGAPDFLSYNGNIGNLPGQTLNTTYAPSAYLDLSALPSAGILPVATGGAKPFTPVPMTNRTAGITGYADHRVTPYIQNFSFSVQRELAHNLTLDVSWVGNKATKLYGGTQLNDTNIFENGILQAFNVTRAGGTAPLFDQMLKGINLGNGVVNGTTLTGSQALRLSTTTNSFIANGDVGSLANFFNTSTVGTGTPGGILRKGGLPENFIVVNPQFGSVNLEGNNSNSNYHSLQSLLTKRLSNGLYTQVSYTFSKALGDNSVRDIRNRQLSKGLLGIDRRHIFKINGTYELPFGPNHAFLANAPSAVQRVVEGWELSSAFQWLSGAALSFTSGLGTNNYRSRLANTADLVGTLPSDLGKVEKGDGFVQYFSNLTVKTAPQPNFGGNASVAGRFTNQVVVDKNGKILLQNPEPGAVGNTAANLPQVKGPSALNFDMALTKKIRVGENKAFSLRADAVNILNRPIWGNPNTSINSTSFGRITTASGNRTITFNARIDF